MTRKRWISLPAALVVGSMSGQACAAPTPAFDPATYTHPQRMVAVGDDRRMNMFCLGHGAPVVILDAGTGGDSVDWRYVQGPIARLTTVCSYDRAGYGFSDPSNRPMDATNSVDDLHRLLRAAGFSAPIVLVGHSIGGLYATLYADRYPRDVAAMVLVDPAFLDSDDPDGDGLSPSKTTEIFAGQRGFVAGVKRCLEMARRHDVASMRVANPRCLDDPPNADAVLHDVLDRQEATASFYAANYSEISSEFPIDGPHSLDDDELAGMPNQFGSMPLVVLTAGLHPLPFSDFTAQDVTKVFTAWKDGHDRLATLSTRGESVLVPDAGHYIQIDRSQIVIMYVDQVVDQVRNSR